MATYPAAEEALPAPAVEHRWRKRWWLYALVLLAIAAIALWLARPKTQDVAARFVTVPVTRGSLQARITASGTLSALVTVQVGSQVSGRIQSLKADYNSVVKKGQVIATLDPALFNAAVAQAEANVLAARGNRQKAEATLANDRLQFRRNQALAARKLIAQSDVDNSATLVRVDQAAVIAARGTEAQAEASLAQAQINLQYATIRSPIDGVVISRSVDVGQTVAATLQAPTLFTIAQDLTRMQVDTNVAEADVGHLQKGMRTTFTVDAYPNEQFAGAIREVRNAPQTVQNVVTYDAVIEVDNRGLKLKPGMTANVTVVFADREDALKVPNAALRFRASPELLAQVGALPTTKGDQRVVWMLEGQNPRPRVVRVGVTDGTTTEVVDGLQQGERVVTEATGAGNSGPGRYGRVF